jgi:hypothetical protein
VSADCGCLLNIGHAAAHQEAPLAVEHLASFLWRRTGGDARPARRPASTRSFQTEGGTATAEAAHADLATEDPQS